LIGLGENHSVMLKKSILWLIVFLLLFVFYRQYQLPSKEQKKVQELFLQGRKAINLTELNYSSKDPAEGVSFSIKRTRNYTQQTETSKKKSNGQSIEDSIAYLPEDFIRAWDFVGKEGIPLRQASFANFITSLFKLKPARVLQKEEVQSLSVYGLDSPLRTVSLGFDSGEIVEISCSSLVSPFGVFYCSIHGDEKLYVFREIDLGFMHFQEDGLFADLIFNLVRSDVKKIFIQRGSESLELDLSVYENPLIISPFKGKASFKFLDDLFRDCRDLLVDKWESYGQSLDLKKFNLDVPKVSFKFVTDKGEYEYAFSEVFDESKKDDKGKEPSKKSYVYVKDLNAIGRILATTTSNLYNLVNDVRERKQFRFSLFDVNQVKFNLEGSFYEGDFKDGKWVINDKEVEFSKFESAFGALKDIEAQSFKPFKSDAIVEMKLFLKTNSGVVLDCIFSGSVEGERLVKCDEEFSISEKDFQDFRSKLKKLVEN